MQAARLPFRHLLLLISRENVAIALSWARLLGLRIAERTRFEMGCAVCVGFGLIAFWN